ncbi:type I polyketide synthase [Streptomyces sp. AK02-01A]|uniref:type I polyketide synthase n=1 Tax=Streptomyces sp. AK02-01A TaxID=3028648 RepID=UPI0029A5EFF4|nr:type I polyketide synthase [Streptomyces sp. AK02-01A]MDX3851635.1 type I polyketide synthase [Streptomyces sp. AK02-01A]
MPEERIAVIGMALRFPGADTAERYWRDIRSGISHVRRFTDAEFAAAGMSPAEYGAAGFTGASALLDGIDGFDAEFFGMSGREATVTDPQQRLFLECCYKALEDGGYAGAGDTVRTGVYASAGYRLYSLHSYLAGNLAEEAGSGDWLAVKQIQVGNYPDFTANRAAFRLGLTGPAVNVATACSSALVSVHLACQALRAGDADLMVVGSAALHVPQVTGHRHMKGSTISRSGTVRAFDADADGTVGGNGVAAVLLKPLDRALADGDTVHAVILGSAVTNDGAGKAGFAAPSAAGQRDAVLGALRAAGVPADSVGYLETHGTGTLKGDPIEFAGLTEAFRRHTDRIGFCALGSAKPAIGHLDSAAGLAGLIKAVLVLRHGIVPPLVNFSRPNPALALATSPFLLPERERAWPVEGDGPRRAGVHSIGLGGTNAHVVLEQAPPVAAAVAVAGTADAPRLLPLSGHSQAALVAYARAFRDHLARRPATAPADLLVSTALGRRHLRHRLVVTSEDARAGLDAFLAGVTSDAYTTGTVADSERPPAPVFLFGGQGGGRPGMAAGLAARFPVVAEVLARCARVYEEETGSGDFLDRVVRGHGPAPWDTAFAQPALFALQIAQARLWRHLGVTPSLVAGHSVGEYAALCVAGALSTEDAMRLLCRRGRLMRSAAAGAMLAVFVPETRVKELLGAVEELELAVINGPGHHVVAGPPEAVAAARASLAERGETFEPLAVDRAFHSALLDPVLDELRTAAGRARPRPLRIAFVSGLDGVVRPPGWLPDAGYLVRQARAAVDFHAVLRTVAPDPGGPAVLLELGPTAALTGMARRTLPGVAAAPTRRLWEAVALLHCSGADIDWTALLAGRGGRRVPLPTYPFQHQSYWTGPPPVPVSALDHDRPTEDGMTEQAVLERVLELTARHLGYELPEVGADRSYVGLGADSLQLVGMVRQLEAEFGAEIAIREILEEAGTPRLTARLITARTAPAQPEPEAQVEPEPAPEPAYATRAEIEELSRQIRQLAQAQSAMLTQLSDAVALLTGAPEATDR